MGCFKVFFAFSRWLVFLKKIALKLPWIYLFLISKKKCITIFGKEHFQINFIFCRLRVAAPSSRSLLPAPPPPPPSSVNQNAHINVIFSFIYSHTYNSSLSPSSEISTLGSPWLLSSTNHVYQLPCIRSTCSPPDSAYKSSKMTLSV